MDVSGVGMVDLVAGDLAVEPALRFLRRVDPHRLRVDPLYAPGGAHDAVAMVPSVTGRMGAPPAGRCDREAMMRQGHRDTRIERAQRAHRDAPVAPPATERFEPSTPRTAGPSSSSPPGCRTATTW